MPFIGLYPFVNDVVGPATQGAYVDATSTVTGFTTFDGATGFCQFAGVGSVTLSPLVASGQSVLCVSGQVRQGTWADNGATVAVRVRVNGVQNQVYSFTWRPGEPTFYEEVRIVGEEVSVSVTAAAYDASAGAPTATAAISLNAFLLSL